MPLAKPVAVTLPAPVRGLGQTKVPPGASAFRATIPMFCVLCLFSIISLVDMVLAGLLGSASQAALGIADQIIFSNMLVMNGFCAGVSALLSQAHGAGNYALADLYVKHSQLGSAIVGILATIIGYSTAGAIAQAFAGDPAVRQQAALFIQLCALGNLPWALVLCQGAIFRASGLATLGIVQWIIVTFLCIGGELASFFCVHGGRSLVPLAICWDVAICVGCLVGARSLRGCSMLSPIDNSSQLSSLAALSSAGKSSLFGELSPVREASQKPSAGMPSLSTCTKMTLFILHTRSILAIGIPVMVGEMCWLVSNLLILSILSCLTHATQAQAAWAIHLKIEETIGYLPLMACCQATATLVGNRLGAGDAGGARQIARHLARRAALAMLAVGCATALAAPYIVPFVSADGQVRQLAQQLLISSIVTFPVNAVALVLSAALEGAGATTLPMVVNVVGLVVVRLPLAWIFAMPLGWGVVGAWAAKCLSNLITFSGMVQVFGRLAPKFGTAR